MNSILFLESNTSVPVPHYLNENTPVTNALDIRALFAQVKCLLISIRSDIYHSAEANVPQVHVFVMF